MFIFTFVTKPLAQWRAPQQEDRLFNPWLHVAVSSGETLKPKCPPVAAPMTCECQSLMGREHLALPMVTCGVKALTGRMTGEEKCFVQLMMSKLSVHSLATMFCDGAQPPRDSDRSWWRTCADSRWESNQRSGLAWSSGDSVIHVVFDVV